MERRIPTVAASTLANNNKHAVGLVSCVSDKLFFESVPSALSSVSPLGTTPPNSGRFHARCSGLSSIPTRSVQFQVLGSQGVSFVVTAQVSKASSLKSPLNSPRRLLRSHRKFSVCFGSLLSSQRHLLLTTYCVLSLLRISYQDRGTSQHWSCKHGENLRPSLCSFLSPVLN